MWGRKVERNPGKKEMATPQESSWKGTSYMDEKLLDNTGYLVCAGTEDALQDIIHPGIQRSRFSLALKVPPCVPGYTFIISLPTDLLLLHGPVVLFPSLMTLPEKCILRLFSEPLLLVNQTLWFSAFANLISSHCFHFDFFLFIPPLKPS